MGVYRLSEPVEYGAKTYTEVVYADKLRAIHFKKNRPADMGEGSQMIKYLSSCLNEPEPFIEMLPARDMFKLLKILNEVAQRELEFLEISTS